MRRGMSALVASVVLAMSAQLAHAMAVPVGPTLPLGPYGLAMKMEQNSEVALYVARRGYPDWAEVVEVDAELPLGTQEIHLFYLRLDREIVFTDASILGRRDIGVRLYDRPLDTAKREMIEAYFLARDPARRAELAAMRADAAADRAEAAAEDLDDVADRAEGYSRRMEHAFFKGLRK
jgi:hypothetical protein